MSVQSYLQDKSKVIDTYLESLFTQGEVPQQNLYHAAKYSLLAGGKRLRPALAIATAEAFGCDESKVLRTACAIEMIHTYSLIHDDLPCMDDDDFRRGKPTLHKVFPESHAVLAGDFLLTHAFHLVASDPHLSDSQKVSLISLLSSSAGDVGMIGGQIMDIEAEGKAVDLKTLETIHSNKTGAMITASIETGAIIAGIEDKYIKQLREFGQNIGLAFQVIDDILDVTSSQEELGKTSASDIINNKSTYVSLMGVDEARQKAQDLLISAKGILEELPLQTAYLNDIADYVVSRSH
ncbi:MAG: farnesyl diphosphate synthase [Chlamydiota bacterium]|nr:farnesyl diphosphate synthase [Chlamydiota bacterium]